MSLLRRRALMMANVSPYEELKYLQSSNTQYIITGKNAGANISLDTEITPIMGSTTNTPILGDKWFYNSFFLAFVEDELKWHYGNMQIPLQGIKKYHVQAGAGYLTVDGVTKTSSYGSLTALPIYLFRTSDKNIIGALKINTLKLFDNNVMILNLVPRLRKSDNKPGMLDLVTNTFFVNQGTGEFGYERMDGTIVQPI